MFELVEKEMMGGGLGWAWRAVLALFGCLAAAYVGDELLGGEALGWMVGGATRRNLCAFL